GGGALVSIALPSAAPTTVLVVDDNPDVRRLFRRYLGGGLYRVLEAEAGAEAVRIAAEGGTDVVTLDVMMPSQDGWETLQTLRNRPETKEIPVLVCSVLP